MGTRIRIGKGFTYGRSGIRWGHSLPWKDGYGSVGASGTLITGGPLRHWEPNRRAGAPVAAGQRERTWTPRAILLAVLIVAAFWGFSAFLNSAESSYAKSQTAPAILKALGEDGPVDCATDPLAPYLYSCTETPAIPGWAR